jgi:hypothetical protein
MTGVLAATVSHGLITICERFMVRFSPFSRFSTGIASRGAQWRQRAKNKRPVDWINRPL